MQVRVKTKSFYLQNHKSSRVGKFLRNPWGVGPAFLVLVLIVVAAVPQWFAPYSPYAQIPGALTAIGAPHGPSTRFILGVDPLGRDVLSRIIWGTRATLEVGLGATTISMIVGTAVGVIAGYFGGAVDFFLGRVVDVLLAFPALLFVVLLVSVLSPSLLIIMVVLAFFGWAPIARFTRGLVLTVRQEMFVESAAAIGATHLRVMVRHILRNIISQAVVYGLTIVGANVLTLAALSYLGLGLPPPAPNWGAMVYDGQTYLQTAPWLFFYPGLAISLTIVAFNLLGDALMETIGTVGR